MRGQWITAAVELLDRLWSTQAEAIGAAVSLCADAIGSGGLVHLFGTGHSRIPVEEMFPRYGSYPGFHPIVELSTTFHTQVVGANGQRQAMFIERVEGLAEVILSNFRLAPPDVLMAFSAGGLGANTIEMAVGAHRRGLPVIAVTSLAQSGAGPPTHSSGTRLSDHADVVIDLCTPAADALVTIDGLESPVGPGSSIAAIAVVNEIKVQTAQLLVERGVMPPVLTSASVVGADRSAELFDSAYREHARRAAAVLAGGDLAGARDDANRTVRGALRAMPLRRASRRSASSGARACSIASTAAPTMPARTPDDDATMRRSAVASGSERRYTTSRTPASSGSPASASEPPMTMMLGLSRLTALANTSPMVRPASRIRPIASVDPARARATTSRLDPTSIPTSANALATAAPEATGFETTDVAAATQRPRDTGHLDVAEVACRAVGAAAQRPVADDPATDAGRDLDEHQVVDIRVCQEPLAKGHHVDVVVDDDIGAAQRLADEPRDVESIPAGHDRRTRRATGGELDRAGEADANTDDVGDPPAAPAHEGAAAIDDPRQHLLGTDGDVEVDDVIGEDRGGEVGDGETDVGGADVGTEHQPCARVEREPGGRASASRRRLAGGSYQRAGDQGVDPLGDRRATEARVGGELTTCARRTVTEQLQQRSGAAGATAGELAPHRAIEPHPLSIAPGHLLLDIRQKSSRVAGKSAARGDAPSPPFS